MAKELKLSALEARAVRAMAFGVARVKGRAFEAPGGVDIGNGTVAALKRLGLVRMSSYRNPSLTLTTKARHWVRRQVEAEAQQAMQVKVELVPGWHDTRPPRQVHRGLEPEPVTVAEFVRENDVDEEEAGRMAAALAKGLPYRFGGGAEAEFTLYPAS